MISSERWRSAGTLVAAAMVLVGVVGCSDDEAATGAGAVATTAAVTTVAIVTPDPQLPLVDYYLELGVPQAIVDCYVPALDELGVTSVLQLEQDQELGARAAELFAACAAADG